MKIEVGMDLARSAAMKGWADHILRMSREEHLTSYEEYERIESDSPSESQQLEFGDFDIPQYPEDSLNAS